MVVKKGEVGVVDYHVYEDVESDKGVIKSNEWTRVSSEFAPKLEKLMDSRKSFRFRFGMNEIHPEIEHALEHRSRVCLRHNRFVYVVELRPGSEAPKSMTTDEIFSELLTLKQLGNDALKSGNLQEAYTTYKEGIQLLTSPGFNRRTERDLKEVFIPLYLNLALCCLKTQRFAETITSCGEVLEVDPKNVKALCRRASARIENQELGAAKRDLLVALSVEPNNKEVSEKLEVVKKLAKNASNFAQKSMYQKMVNVNRTRVKISFRIATEEESIIAELLDDQVPRTVENFKKLLEKYASSTVFKLARDQFLQTGDYEFNDGSGGNASLVDRTLKGRSFMNDENLTHAHDRKGLLGMANYGSDTVNSQFYITLGACPELDGKHVIFGYLEEGPGVLDKINEAAADDFMVVAPMVPVVISRIELVK
jgi:cyclophilin family peptidyl-prolyl cis-trans isomerase